MFNDSRTQTIGQVDFTMMYVAHEAFARDLGRMTQAQAKDFLMHEVALSEPFAQSEVDRYAYRLPGQATSYYYGYVKLRALKMLAETELGERFDLKAFNDFVIAQGILPPALMKQAVLQDFIPAQRAGAASVPAAR